MFKTRFIISSIVFIIFLIITPTINNKTRIIEKQIFNLNTTISSLEQNINETQLDFHYLTSPAEIEKKLNIIGFANYQPISHSKIFFDISDFLSIENKFSNLNNLNEKEIQKK